MAKVIIEPEVFFTDKEIFGDTAEHPYEVKCYNGHAVATLTDDASASAPKTLRLEYPKRRDVLKDNDLCDYILEYRGLYDLTKKDIHYGDIMMCCGKIIKPKQKTK